MNETKGLAEEEVRQQLDKLVELKRSIAEEIEMNPSAVQQEAASPPNEDIYTNEIGQLGNTVIILKERIGAIKNKISILLSPGSVTSETKGMPDVPASSPTVLSGAIAELASGIASLGEEIQALEERIIV